MDLRNTAIDSREKIRLVAAKQLSQFNSKLSQGTTQREAAQVVGIPRSTLLHWKKRTSQIPLSKPTINFFESPDGTIFLERLVNVLQFVMTQVGPCGIRLLSLVLKMSSLDYFVASSYGALRERGIKMEEAIVAFGEEEKSLLAKSMPNKKISIVEDETFHHKPCLVAIEPVSNFILLEEYSEKRDAASWNDRLEKALNGLPVTIIQSTSDEARGIIAHVEQCLGAHHSPDIFHVQQDISKGTSAAMASKVRSAQETLDKLIKEHETRLNRGLVSHQRGRPSLLFEKSKDELEKDLTHSKENLSILQSQQSAIKESKKGIAESYHPYDLNNGSERSARQVQDELLQHFNVIEENAKAAQLNQSAIDKIKKAKRVCSGLVNTISFFWMLVYQLIDSLFLSKEMEQLMRNILIPAHYLMIASKKYKKAEERKRIYQQAMQLLISLEDNPTWKHLNKIEQGRLTDAARNCAQLFQRSSSCLEGRNGYLSLRHHGLHHLSTRKLGALTVIHNYFITRSDNTTAAERFFGKKHKNLFEYVIEKMPSLSRPSIQKAILRRAA
jgi:PAS domain-containing protein